MAKVARAVTFACYFHLVTSVPPSPTSAITDMLQAEFSTMKNTIQILSDQWERWNTLFLTSLEPRIASTASTLASIDSNIHNLQERAHVWDTFQLHVSAWNEQLASLDRKMDIISKAQEKLLNLDGRMSTISNMEYKLDNTIKILNNIYDSVTNLDTTLHSRKSHDTLFNEFATRGVLSSIKLVEKKLDRVLIATQNSLLKDKLTDVKPKFTIKCNTPRILEELLNDISSKVDVIFDNISGVSDSDDDDYDGDYLDVEGSGASLKRHVRNKRLKKAIKKIVLPCKQTNRILEEILNRSVRIENTSMQILNKENMNLEQVSKNNCNSIESFTEKFSNNMNPILDSYFSQQKTHLESLSNELTKQCCNSKQKPTEQPSNAMHILQPSATQSEFPDDLFEVTTASSALFDISQSEETITESTTSQDFYNAQETFAPKPTWRPIINENKSSCEDLEYKDSSGVYIFGNQNGEVFSNKRYCEIRDDGKWTVIQRRDNYSVQHNFNTSWVEYKHGFGDMHSDFWMGNDFLSLSSNRSDLVLRIELEDFDKNSVWAEYDTFKVAPERENYRLTVGGYTGNASDSFSGHSGSKFSTYDRINDEAPGCCPCAVSYGAGWWFNRCFESNLNGVYHRRPNDNNYFRGIIWEHWLGNYSLKKTVMMVKTKNQFSQNQSSTSFSSSDISFYEDP